MEESKLKYTVLKILAAQLAGVLIGTFLSAPIHGFPLREFPGAFWLAPLEMTVGVRFTYEYVSKLTGIGVVFGFLTTMMCSCWALMHPRITWLYYGVFTGTTLWSIGNIPSFCVMMSV